MELEIGPCAYCGTATSNQDDYGLACEYCVNFWLDNPTPPVPPPDGSVLINLNTLPDILKSASGEMPTSPW